jgi:fused signal recognition particle receptor
VTGVVMTKLDGTARGGVLIPVAEASKAPIKLIGVGEGIEDLQAFDARAFARSLVGLDAA